MHHSIIPLIMAIFVASSFYLSYPLNEDYKITFKSKSIKKTTLGLILTPISIILLLLTLSFIA